MYNAGGPVFGMMGSHYSGAMAHAGNPFFAMIIAVVLVLTGIVLLGFWLSMLIHVIKHEHKEQAVWIFIMLFANIWGAVIYYFAVKHKMDHKR